MLSSRAGHGAVTAHRDSGFRVPSSAYPLGLQASLPKPRPTNLLLLCAHCNCDVGNNRMVKLLCMHHSAFPSEQIRSWPNLRRLANLSKDYTVPWA